MRSRRYVSSMIFTLCVLVSVGVGVVCFAKIGIESFDPGNAKFRGSSFDEGWITHDVAVSPKHDVVVRGRFHNELGIAELWIEDAVTGAQQYKLDAWGVIRAFAFREDGKRFVASADHGPLRVLDTETAKVIAELKGHAGWVHAVGFGAGYVVSAGRDDTMRVWNAENGEQLWIKEEISLAAVAVAPDGSQVAGTDGAGNLFIWNLETGEQLQQWETGESGWSFHISYSHNSKFVATGSRRIRTFSAKTGEIIGTIEIDEKKRASAIAISDDGKLLATAGPTAEVKVWAIGDSQPKHSWATPRSVGALNFSANGRQLCGAQYTGMCHRWDLDTGAFVKSKRWETPWIETETDVDQLMLSVGFFDTWRGIAVGGDTEKGQSIVMISVDDGQSWCKQHVASKGRLYSIDVLDNETAIAVGYDGVAIRTRDRGENWEVLETPETHWLAGVDFVDTKTGYAVGGCADHPVIWKTTDGGNTWLPIHDRLPQDTADCQLRDVKFLDLERGFAVGTAGLLLETKDAGETWQRLDSGTDAWLRALHVRGEIIHIAGKGVMLRSEDLGKTWSKLPIPPRRKLIDVAFASDDHGWITNFDGEILETRDAGQSWESIHVHKNVTTGIHSTSERTLVLTGDGQVLRQRR